MNTTIYPTTASPCNISVTQALKIAEERFEAALKACKDDWESGNQMVVLQDNIPQLFGGLLEDHFKHCLGEVCGAPIEITVMDGGDGGYHTLVQMPKPQILSPQVLPSAQPVQTSRVEHTTIDMHAIAAGLKKAPRPMNCWIIFRDVMHKQLKAELPNLTVQEISTRCSRIWHNLSPEAKKPWQDAARSAKEEHLRQHPDYKYSPRKPGEKKKRQSRKAKRAAAATAAPKVLNFQLTPTITTSTPEPICEPLPTASNIIADMGNIFTENASQYFESTGFPESFTQMPMTANFVHDAESIRHGLLDAEFAFDFDMDTTFALFNDETFAFRDGADGDATLPAFFEDTY
uniref:HMG DNA binding protein n=1 Tax=Stemphylium sp. EGS49-037 TaxID=235046 RepID=Q69FE8_9PLEO|nr:HMG DNA binding protein [Stemphylium sp. EGS49-037]